MENENVNVGNKKRVVIPESRNRGSSTHLSLRNETTNDKRGRFPSPSRTGELGNDANFMSCCFDGGGFTLIELLVVVLIISILAAVALPQYTQAVEKSRFATYRALANSMAQAADVFYLANGTWPTSLDELDLEFPADMSTESSLTYGICRKNNKMYCCMMIPTVDWNGGAVRCGDNDYHLSYGKIYANDHGTPSTKMSCSAKEEKYKAICKAISGGKNGTTSSIFTPDGWIYGYSYYEID